MVVVGLALALVVTVRVEEARVGKSRSRVAELALQAANVTAERDSTRDVALHFTAVARAAGEVSARRGCGDAQVGNGAVRTARAVTGAVRVAGPDGVTKGREYDGAGEPAHRGVAVPGGDEHLGLMRR